MWLQVALLLSFSWLGGVPLRVRTASVPTAVPTPVDGHSCASLVSAAMSGAAMNRRASFGLDSSGYLPRSEISGSYGSS